MCFWKYFLVGSFCTTYFHCCCRLIAQDGERKTVTCQFSPGHTVFSVCSVYYAWLSGWLQWKKPLVCLCKSTWHEVQMADFFSFSCLVGFLSFFLNSYSTHWLCCSCLLIATSVFVHFHYRTVSTRLTSDLAYIMIPKKELPFWIRYFPRPGK